MIRHTMSNRLFIRTRIQSDSVIDLATIVITCSMDLTILLESLRTVIWLDSKNRIDKERLTILAPEMSRVFFFEPRLKNCFPSKAVLAPKEPHKHLPLNLGIRTIFPCQEPDRYGPSSHILRHFSLVHRREYLQSSARRCPAYDTGGVAPWR